MTDTTIPRDDLLMAQATVLAEVIRDPSLAAEVFTTAPVEAFDPPHRHVAEAIHHLRLNRGHIDGLTVADEMARRGTLSSIGGRAGVMELDRYAVAGRDTALYAAGVLSTRVKRRRMWKVGARLMELAEQQQVDPYHLASKAARELQGVVDAIDHEGDVDTPTLAEFLTGDDPEHDWVVPGLLERGDRLMLTGSEGGGKSTLLRQLAICAAAGLQPFTGEVIEPRTVLLVDLENSVVQLRRAFRGLAVNARRYGLEPSHRMFVETRMGGLDLSKSDDEAWLLRRVAGLQPDLLVTGPAYKLHSGDPNSEETARRVTYVLDRCREAANCALVLEAHAGHAQAGAQRPIRPTGSSLWLRWPEFGYGLRPAEGHTQQNRVMDFDSWRGDREARVWPSRLVSGGVFPWKAQARDDGWTPSLQAVN